MALGIMNHVIQNYNKKPIALLSMGVGGCLQDLIIMAKLVTNGMQKIHLTMIEPMDISKRTFPAFSYLMKKCKEFLEVR